MIVRTRTALRVERESGISVKIATNGNGSVTGPMVVLLPGDELRLPGGTPGEELIIDIDLSAISSSNHSLAVLRLRKEMVHNDDEARQLELL